MKGKDTFRKVYKPLSDSAKKLVVDIKDKAEELLTLLENVKSREMSLAQTNLEQCTMWATKAVVLHDEMNNSQGKSE